MSNKIFKNNFYINFLRVTSKHFTQTVNRTIGWPPLIISGPPGAGKVKLNKNNFLKLLENS